MKKVEIDLNHRMWRGKRKLRLGYKVICRPDEVRDQLHVYTVPGTKMGRKSKGFFMLVARDATPFNILKNLES